MEEDLQKREQLSEKNHRIVLQRKAPTAALKDERGTANMKQSTNQTLDSERSLTKHPSESRNLLLSQPSSKLNQTFAVKPTTNAQDTKMSSNLLLTSNLECDSKETTEEIVSKLSPSSRRTSETTDVTAVATSESKNELETAFNLPSQVTLKQMSVAKKVKSDDVPKMTYTEKQDTDKLKKSQTAENQTKEQMEQPPNIFNFSIRSSIINLLPENCTCMLCCTTFDNPYELQVHLVQQLHLPREKLLHVEHFLYPQFDCIQCNAKRINRYHTCLKPLVEHFKSFASIHANEGYPLTCIFCDGERMKSAHHLILHVVIYHGFHNQPVNENYLECPICFSVFKTRNSFVVESHALDVHLPEMVVKKQKLMHPEDQSHNFTVRQFSCHFENERYTTITKRSLLNNCVATYADLPSLMGHLCYAHYPLPPAFPISKTRPINCNACQFRFANRTHLRDHVYSSHKIFLKYRITSLLQANDSLLDDHCDPRVICHLCWSDEGSVERLQTHILVYHVGSWRYCGFCTREICMSNETMSPVLLYLNMERHVELHVKQLREHFEEMSAICQLKKPAHNITKSHDPNENFFGTLVIRDHKEKPPDRTEAILSTVRHWCKRRTLDTDDFE